MLAQQLHELENDGFITRQVFPMVPPSVECSITMKGKGVIPVIEAIRDWGNEVRRSTSKAIGEGQGSENRVFATRHHQTKVHRI